MELLTLDSNYQPSELVERYNSLVWTERYSKTGDFQLVSNDVERMINLLPLESVVSLRESTVPMLVEVHKIEKGINGAPTLTVTGRSFESVLERRIAAQTNGFYNIVTGDLSARIEWFEDRDKPSDAAYHVLRTMLGDIERENPNDPNVTDFFEALSPALAIEDAFDMVNLIPPADYNYSHIPGSDPEKKYEIKPGNLYTVVNELVSANHHGIKAVRPDLTSNKIVIEIYNGADLTNEVAFDAKFDQFEDTTYLLSYAGSTNVAYVFSKTTGQVVEKTVGSKNESGLNRRVLFLDVSSEELADTTEARRTRGLIELYKYNATALFDGQVSEQVAAGYNRDYFMGDIIRLDGEYGLSRNVRVAEFIRSDDNTGKKAYPTFEMVDE